MITIILSAALLIAVAGLAVEIGIASWNIRRAKRYQSGESAAKRLAEKETGRRLESVRRQDALLEYSEKVSWLLAFLYKRYDSFSDLKKEVQAGPNDIAGDISVGEADDKYLELKKALKIIRATVKASERLESIISQLGQILEDIREEDEGEDPSVESAGTENSQEESPDGESER